jgi:hypothetical protein
MEKFCLFIEKAKDGTYWGRVEFEDDLILDSADSVETLEKNMKKLLRYFHQIDPLGISFQPVNEKTL